LYDVNRLTTTAAVGNQISNVQTTDTTRVKFNEANSGTLAVTAIVRAYTNGRPVREFNITMKFDRTSYRYDPLDLNAIARIEEFYRPTVDMPGFTTNDYTQLMTGTQYPDVNVIDPGFTYGRTYAMLYGDINTVDNTITLRQTKYSPFYTGQIYIDTAYDMTAWDADLWAPDLPPPTGQISIPPEPPVVVEFAEPVQMLFIESPFQNDYSTTFGLTNRNSYWFMVDPTNPLAVAAYRTKNDALNNINRVQLFGQWQGLLLTGNYDSVIASSTNTANEPYLLSGGVFEQSYSPEELMAGLVTDTINITVTSKPGSTWSPLTPATGLSNSSTMAHTGFNMHRFTATPGPVLRRDGVVVPNAIDFSNQVANPTNLALYVSGKIYQLSALEGSLRRLVEGKFTVDWLNEIIEITDPLIINALPSLRSVQVVLYEFGNANQLIRSNSTIYAMQDVFAPVLHTEILLDVPYSSGTSIIDGVTYTVEGITLPTAANYWETVAVFLNGERLQYDDPLYPVTPGYVPVGKFTVQPQRTFDPVNDPYNPAKLVFDSFYDPDVDYISFVATADFDGISGISIPETQWFTGKVGVGIELDLNAFLGDANLVPPKADNIILEINGQRYDDSAPTIVNFTASDQILAYPVPVYAIASFNPANVDVRVNGVLIPTGNTTWLTNFDLVAGAPAGFDADFGLLYGYFDDGVPFDSTTMVAIVFDAGYLTPGDLITIEYDAASVPQPFTVVPNVGLVGGKMTLNVPVVSTDVISVITFNRTTQQSLATQVYTDITVSQITGIVASFGLPVRVTFPTDHNLSSGDFVTINGNAAPELDGNQYYVQVVNAVTVALWENSSLTIPFTFFSTSPLIPGPFNQSYVQIAAAIPLAQPLYDLYDTDRLWVTIIRSGLPILQDYISPDRLRLQNNSGWDALPWDSSVWQSGDNANRLAILDVLLPTDLIVVTSMVPSASPNSTQFRINLDKTNGESEDNTGWSGLPWDTTSWDTTDVIPPPINDSATVYRQNQQSRTYMRVATATTLQPSDQIEVADVRRLVGITVETRTIVTGVINGVTQNFVLVDGVNTPIVTSITVVNSATGAPVTDFAIQVVSNNTLRLVFSSSPPGLSVDVTIAQGNQIMVQGEQIGFANVDIDTNTLSGLVRGLNGTIVNETLYKGSPVVAVSNAQQMNKVYYNYSWYTAQTDTIPLQLSVNPSADFLNITV
jgi:hypothetical protein